MKTTLDLPDELLERAERVAVARGVTLRALVGIALATLVRNVEAEGGAPPGRAARRRVSFPLFASHKPGSLDLSGRDIANTEAEEDVRRHGLPR